MFEFVVDLLPIGSKTRIQRPVAKSIVYSRLQIKWNVFFLLAGNEKKKLFPLLENALSKKLYIYMYMYSM